MQKPFIIAEIAQGYEGNEKLVELYVKAVSSSGADAIKFQIFYADELALVDYKYYELFKSLELPFCVWEKAVRESHKSGLEFYSDVMGLLSLRKLEKIKVDGYKIHATDINNITLLKEVAKIRKKVLLSTGGCRLEEIDRAVDILKGTSVTIMHGFQAEPTSLGDNHLNKIKTLRERYKSPVGFQDHTKGDTVHAFYIPFIAVGLGASLIEKHLTLSRAAELEDHISALTAEEFSKWAKEIKQACVSLGKDRWILTEREAEYRSKVKRAVCSSGGIKKGKTILEKDLSLKRSGDLYAISDINEVIGKKSKKNISKNVAIKKGHLL